jgi:biotin carboxylase
MTGQKRVLILGGSFTQIPAIKCVKDLGFYVVTCDYLPGNPGHKFADEYHNVSTTDMEAVQALAKELRIDGIIAYASDSAAPTAAYAADKLHLPTNPYESVMILCRKDLFRAFLAENGFNVPKSRGFYDLDKAKEFFNQMEKPVMVKPADACGSKGVQMISDINELEEAFSYALRFSREKMVVIEGYIQHEGPQIMGDGFVVDGKLVFTAFCDHYHDDACNPFAPIGGSYPSQQSMEIRIKAEAVVQHILTLLKWKSGALNIEYLVDKKGEIYLLEIGPRNGGNFIPDMIKIAADIDLITYTIYAALGLDCSSLEMKEPHGYYAYYVLHSARTGILKEIIFSDEIQRCIRFYQPYLNLDDEVPVFSGAHCTIGVIILEFASREDMIEKMNNMDNYIFITVNNNIVPSISDYSGGCSSGVMR